MRSGSIVGLGIAAAIAVAAVGLATTPRTMTVQGKLTDAGGGPVSAGDYTLVFRVYDAAVGGTQKWPSVGGESHVLAVGTNGVWSVNIGEISALNPSVFSDTTRYLEITVTPPAGPTETLSRVKLTSAPYVYEAAQLDGKTGSEYVPVDDSTLVIHPSTNVVSFGTMDEGDYAAPIYVEKRYATASPRRGLDVHADNFLSGSVYGLYGEAGTPSSSGTGPKAGVRGDANGVGTGFGVYGYANTSGVNYAIYGVSVHNDSDDYAGYFIGSKVHIATVAGSATANVIGNRWRDNSIVAWGKVTGSNGETYSYEFGVDSVARNGAGDYTVYVDDDAMYSATLIPVASPECDSKPTSAATARIVYINQTGTRTFDVYITNGNFVATDNDFTFIVTAR